jgi:hypothetical protein
MKPGYLSVISDPPGASVTISEKKRVKLSTTPTGLVLLDPKAYVVRVAKPGFEPYETRVVLHGGDRLVLPVIRLQPKHDPANPEAERSPASGARPENLREVAQRWKAFVYRGFPDTNETKRCYQKKKGLIQQLAGEQGTSAFKGLKAIADGNSDEADPNYGPAVTLLNRLMATEAECRKALETIPAWDGT